MFALFSSPNPNGGSSGPRPIDLQLLPDEDILNIWDQSQLILTMLEAKDVPTQMTKQYTLAVEKELQNRSQRKPNIFFRNTVEQQSENIENNFTLSKKSSALINSIFTTSIIV